MFVCSVPVKRVQLSGSNGDHVIIGDVIQCSANTINPPVSYYWQRYVNESWQQLQQRDDDDDDDDDESDDSDKDDADDNSGSMLRLSTAGVHVLRCVAYNFIDNFVYNATSDNVTLYVVEPGMYSTQLSAICSKK